MKSKKTFEFVRWKDFSLINNFAKKKVLKNKNIFRYNFHSNKSDAQQLMLIFQKRGYFYPPKKFADTKKIYMLIKGKLCIYIFDKKGVMTKKYLLDKKNNICIVNKNVYHLDTPLSADAIHCEVTFHKFSNRKIYFFKKKVEQKIIKKLFKF